jgi:hypothetical protein
MQFCRGLFRSRRHFGVSNSFLIPPPQILLRISHFHTGEVNLSLMMTCEFWWRSGDDCKGTKTSRELYVHAMCLQCNGETFSSKGVSHCRSEYCNSTPQQWPRMFHKVWALAVLSSKAKKLDNSYVLCPLQNQCPLSVLRYWQQCVCVKIILL